MALIVIMVRYLIHSDCPSIGRWCDNEPPAPDKCHRVRSGAITPQGMKAQRGHPEQKIEGVSRNHELNALQISAGDLASPGAFGLADVLVPSGQLPRREIDTHIVYTLRDNTSRVK
ncbi:MAG TPA: hypothetical protein VNL92_07770 [Dehalococcoidia bacterium]|nr:hypothetical protein [Dehalococcoidia bacterium]